jgi:hypothetical protein
MFAGMIFSIARWYADASVFWLRKFPLRWKVQLTKFPLSETSQRKPKVLQQTQPGKYGGLLAWVYHRADIKEDQEVAGILYRT